MSTQYESVQHASHYPEAFGVPAPDTPAGRDVWPRKPGVFVRLASLEPAVDGAEPAKPGFELGSGQFGLVPTWVKSASDAKLRSTKLVNARCEIVTTSNNFRDAWLGAQRCIVPMMSFHADDLRSGKPVPTRITRVDGKPMGVAGLWERWKGAGDEEIVSFCLLTVNANAHALMHRYGQPGSEKRMPVILNEGACSAWLTAPHPEKAREFMRAFSATLLTANPIQK